MLYYESHCGYKSGIHLQYTVHSIMSVFDYFFRKDHFGPCPKKHGVRKSDPVAQVPNDNVQADKQSYQASELN